MPPANQTTIMCEAVFHKNFGRTCFIWNLSLSRRSSVRHYHMSTLNLRVNCPIYLSEFNQNWTSKQILMNVPDVKFHKNRSGGTRLVPCKRAEGQTDEHTWRSNESLLRNLANARKKSLLSVCVDQLCLWKPHSLHSASLWHLNCSWFIAVASVRITLTVTLLLTYRCTVQRHKFNVVVCTP